MGIESLKFESEHEISAELTPVSHQEIFEKEAAEKFGSNIAKRAEGIFSENIKLAALNENEAKSIKEKADAIVIEAHLKAMFGQGELPDFMKDPKVEKEVKEIITIVIEKSKPEDVQMVLSSMPRIINSFYNKDEAEGFNPEAFSTIKKAVEVLPAADVGYSLRLISSARKGSDSGKKFMPKIVEKAAQNRALSLVNYALEKNKDPMVASQIFHGFDAILRNTEVNKGLLALEFGEDDIENMIVVLKYLNANARQKFTGYFFNTLLGNRNFSLNWLSPDKKLAENAVRLEKLCAERNYTGNPIFGLLEFGDFEPEQLDKLIVLVEKAKTKEQMVQIWKDIKNKKINF